MTQIRTIVDVFENVLGVPFNPLWTRSIAVDVKTARQLAAAVSSFYKDFKFPVKKQNEIRPYLFHSFEIGNKPWADFVSFEGEDYNSNPRGESSLLHFLKPFLLYSHAICFLDPLPGLLDYFRSSRCETEYERERLGGLNRLLLEYVKLAELIRNNIVIPVSHDVFGFYSHNRFYPSDDEVIEIRNLLRTIPRYESMAGNADAIRRNAQLVKEQIWLNSSVNDEMDLYFPDENYIPSLQGILRAGECRYSTRDIHEPFTAGVLVNIGSIDTAKISVMDIISIRSGEVFDDYRRVLRGILQRLQNADDPFVDLESEFVNAAREEMAECSEKIAELTKRSTFLKDTFNNLDRVLIGGLFGSLGGIVSGSPKVAIIGAAAGSALRPLYDILRGNLAVSQNSSVRTSLRNHFLVLDPKCPKRKA